MLFFLKVFKVFNDFKVVKVFYYCKGMYFFAKNPPPEKNCEKSEK